MIRAIMWFTDLSNSRRWIVTACFSVVLAVVLFGMTKVMADSQRRGDKPIVTWERGEGDFADISWAATPLPVDGVDAVALASPERTAMAGEIFGDLLSDPTFRYQVQRWFEKYELIGYPDASAMAKRDAASIALAFTDSLIKAAGE